MSWSVPRIKVLKFPSWGGSRVCHPPVLAECSALFLRRSFEKGESVAPGLSRKKLWGSPFIMGDWKSLVTPAGSSAGAPVLSSALALEEGYDGCAGM